MKSSFTYRISKKKNTDFNDKMIKLCFKSIYQKTTTGRWIFTRELTSVKEHRNWELVFQIPIEWLYNSLIKETEIRTCVRVDHMKFMFIGWDGDKIISLKKRIMKERRQKNTRLTLEWIPDENHFAKQWTIEIMSRHTSFFIGFFLYTFSLFLIEEKIA